LPRTPAAAAFLSFLFPGLGLIVFGPRRRGLLIAAPAALMTILAVIFAILDRRAIYDALFSSDAALLGFLALNLAMLGYRVWAIVDSYRVLRRESTPTPKVSTDPDWWDRTAAPAAKPKKPAKASALRPNGLGAAALAIILLVTGGMHFAAAAVGMSARDTINCVFNPDAPCWFGSGNLAVGETAPPVVEEDTPAIDSSATDPEETPTDTATPTASASASASATVSNGPTPLITAGPTTSKGIPIFPVENVTGPNTPPEQWRDDGYLNVLLVGVDQGVGRWSLRPDTMILLQVELASGRSAMYGIPRNLENVPLPPEAANAFSCHCFPYPNLLNGLWRDAVNRPKAYPYPGSDFSRGFKALEGAIGQYLGLHVDGAVVINLMGFVHLIDALGGLDITVPKALKDTRYARPQDGRFVTITIKAGRQHMNGYTALAYARSRHQDSDYGRMIRQQAVLMALREEFRPCALLPRVNDLIGALGSAFWTDMPRSDAAALAALAERVGTGNVKNVALVPQLTGNPVGFLNIPRWMTVRWIVSHGLDTVAPASSPSSGSSGSGGNGGFSC
jgi:LCP family protein required for cell wall assembly